MTLAFPNPSRSFDEQRNAVRFFGHEGVFEIRFFVEAAALANGAAEGTKLSEAQCLAAFDASRAAIQKVAREAHRRSGQNSYVLTAADFR